MISVKQVKPSAEVAVMRPWWASTMAWVMARPSPAPFAGRVLARGVGAVETFKQMHQVFGGNAVTRVDNPAAWTNSRLGSQPHLYTAAGRGVGQQGVGERQVAQGRGAASSRSPRVLAYPVHCSWIPRSSASASCRLGHSFCRTLCWMKCTASNGTARK